MKLIYCVLLLLCPYISWAQNRLYPITVGETFPYKAVKGVVNSSHSNLSLSTAKNKLLLLDFMRTTCGSCIRNLTRIDSLQQRFGSQLEVIVITTQTANTVEQFLKRNRVNAALTLPFVTGDTTLIQLFPHDFISHIAWIGPNGVVRAITSADYVTTDNIEKMLQNEAFKLPVKKDEPAFDYTQPLSTLGPAMQQMQHPVLSQSVLLPYVPGVRPYVQHKTDSAGMERFLFFNFSLPQMIIGLYKKWNICNSKIFIETRKSIVVDFDASTMYRRQWNEQNLFCYEGYFTKTDSLSNNTDRVLRDIATKFNIEAQFISKNIPCRVLTKRDTLIAPLPKSEHAATLWDAVETLNNQFSRSPIIDSVGNIERIILPLHKSNLKDSSLVLQAIQQAGFALKNEQKMMEILLIKEPSPTNYLNK